jgi:FlaA1/EpsC-like NDP-sugar epimerase
VVFARLINRLTILPRWIIIVIDLGIVLVSTTLAYLLRFNFDWREALHFNFQLGLTLACGCALVSTLVTRSYAGIVRYTGIEDGKRIASSVLLSMVLMATANLVYYYNLGRNLLPFSVLLISFPITFLLLFFYRLFVKEVFAYVKSTGSSSKKNNVLIFGAGNLGLSVKNVIESTPYSGMRIVAILEDDVNKAGKKIQGVKIHHARELARLAENFQVKELIVAVNDLSSERKSQIVEECLQLSIKVRMVPPVERWMKGELRLRQLREVRIEDLLGRDVIQFDNPELARAIEGRYVLITGAAGSIGGELTRQIARYKPARLVLVDQAETPLFEMELELTRHRDKMDLAFCVADVTNPSRMHAIFSEYKPQLVFHAAAYKHVPLMEANPVEAVWVNVLGTRLLADLAVQHGVEKFVMISTDKAVNPTSVMGCSKRIAEMYVQSLTRSLQPRNLGGPMFITTRFGNVLGSNGSVIPLFKKQIEDGGPITVTHPEIVRYFMTIPEACRLVLEAGVMGEGGEVFLFDMGMPVRIYDLARKMVKLSGLEEGKDIDIVFTGLREGEKLFEELLTNSENSVPTHHPKILKAKVNDSDFERINSYLDIMADLVLDKNELKVVALMKDIVPEYKSAVSRFQALD